MEALSSILYHLNLSAKINPFIALPQDCILHICKQFLPPAAIFSFCQVSRECVSPLRAQKIVQQSFFSLNHHGLPFFTVFFLHRSFKVLSSNDLWSYLLDRDSCNAWRGNLFLVFAFRFRLLKFSSTTTDDLEFHRQSTRGEPGDLSPAMMSVPARMKTLYKEWRSSYVSFSTTTSAPLPHHVVRIVLYGDACCGKSSLVQEFSEGGLPPAPYQPTIGVEFAMRSLLHFNGTRVKLQIWDTAGQPVYDPITASYAKGAHLFLFCFDVTSSQSLEQVKGRLITLVRTKLGTDDFPCVLVGCKADDGDGGPPDRQVSTEEAQAVAADLDCRYIECSAKTGKNVDRVFLMAATAAYHRNKAQFPPLPPPPPPPPAPKESSSCAIQ